MNNPTTKMFEGTSPLPEIPATRRWLPGLLPKLLALVLLSGVLCPACKTTPPPNSLATHNSSKWESEISAFEAGDRTNRPPKDCIIFVGSSSIRRWTSLVTDFPDLPVVNRGFGGSQLADSASFADRIIVPYQPRQVVIYAGGNDINAGKSPEVVYGDFVALVAKIHSQLPHARIAYISSAPNLQRWAQVEKVRRLNALAEAYCRHHGFDFINVFPLMLGPDGRPKPDIFVADGLHMNPRGYALWKEAIRPHLR
ncbi:MAG TPA: SGNH/GDSL hydrolase family protein [Candidatus Binatia bacterium]|jgi:lysophospholipase L1-like esterase|nr:SGNH/GDSL hydrolase family protein [Candidatus Binatia bacterium]